MGDRGRDRDERGSRGGDRDERGGRGGDRDERGGRGGDRDDRGGRGFDRGDRDRGGRGGYGGDRTCFKCNETGHMARDCPNGDERGGRGSGDRERGGRGGYGGDRACFNCNETGHMARDCPNGDERGGRGSGDRERGGRGGYGGDRACFKCNETGHMARDCPNGDERGSRGGSDRDRGGRGYDRGGRGGFGGERTCFKCNETGHMARDCSTGGDGRGGDDRACFNCKETGHMARDCPNEPSDSNKKPVTYVPAELREDDLYEHIEQGINFSKFDNVDVQVKGENAPRPITSFTDAIVNRKLIEVIRKSKYENPTPIQKYAIPAVLDGHSLMACAQTGSGKTAAFNMPLIQKMLEMNVQIPKENTYQMPLCLVLTPTRELAIQIFTDARKWTSNTNLKVNIGYGGVQVDHQKKEILRGTHMLVGTPGRVKMFLERNIIMLDQLRFLVLDEADRMIDQGFIDDIKEIRGYIGDRDNLQTLMFSATFPNDVRDLAKDFLPSNYLFLTVGLIGAANSDVSQTFVKLEPYEKKTHLKEILEKYLKDASARIMVFVKTQMSTEFLASFMSESNLPSTSIHGKRTQEQREEALRDFRAGKYPIIIATSVAARGLDIKGVTHVINFDLPDELEDYVHRVGRTGRVGNIGTAISFYCSKDDSKNAGGFISILTESNQAVPPWLAQEAGYGDGREGGSRRSNGRDAVANGGNDDCNHQYDNSETSESRNIPDISDNGDSEYWG